MNRIKTVNVIKMVIYYMVPIALLIYNISMIFNNSIWLDEAFSLSMIKQGFGDMIKNTAIDVHPPLYYILLKTLVEVLKFCFNGNIIVTSKFVSIIPIIVLLIINYTIIQKRFGKKTSFLFGIFILGMPQIMKYAIEIRMYSFALLFVTIFYLSCIQWIKTGGKKELYVMSIFAILSAYTHYFAAISVGCLYVYSLIEVLLKKDKNKLKKLLFSIFIVFILYTPWLIILMKQIMTVKESYWIGSISIQTVKEFFKYPYTINGHLVVSIIIGLTLLISLIIMLFKIKEETGRCSLYGFLAPIGTILVGILASIIIRPVFISRYMVCSLGCLWLGVAIILGNILNKKYLFYIIAIIITVISIWNTNRLVNVEKVYKKESEKTINYMQNFDANSTKIIFDSNILQRMVTYYYPNIETYVYNQEITELTKQVYQNENMKELKEIGDLPQAGTEIYLLLMNNNLLKELESNGYKYKKNGIYQIEGYKFSVYKVTNE